MGLVFNPLTQEFDIVPTPYGVSYANSGGDSYSVVTASGYFNSLIASNGLKSGWLIFVQNYGANTVGSFLEATVTGSTVTTQPVGGATSSNPPAILIANSIAWVSADVGTSTTTSGASVSQWNDRSPLANNFTQATSGNQPIFYPGKTPSGLPALQFNSASTQYLSNTISATQAQPITTFVSALISTNANYGTLYDGVDGSHRMLLRQASTNYEMQMGNQSGTVIGSMPFDYDWHVWTVEHNGSSSSVQVDKGAKQWQLAGGTSGAAVNGFTLGCAEQGGTGPLNGYIFEFAAVSGVLASADKINIQSYMLAHLGR